MKKILSFLLITTFLFVFSSCGAETIEIEDYVWKLRTASRIIDGQAVVEAVEEANPAFPDADIVDIVLEAKDGKITISGFEMDTVYEGTYTVEGKNPKGTDYKVTIDGKEGYATVAMTTYADGSEEPTLPINLGDYSIYFYAE